MLEIEDTSSQYERYPDNRYKLIVAGIPKKGNNNVREWDFDVADAPEGSQGIKVFIPPWESGELLLCLGGEPMPDNPKKIKIDYDTVPGKAIEADVRSEKYMGKDKNGNPKEKFKYVLSNIKEGIPF